MYKNVVLCYFSLSLLKKSNVLCVAVCSLTRAKNQKTNFLMRIARPLARAFIEAFESINYRTFQLLMMMMMQWRKIWHFIYAFALDASFNLQFFEGRQMNFYIALLYDSLHNFHLFVD